MAILIEIAALIFIHERVLYRERSFESPNLLHAVNAPAIVNETSDGISLRKLLKVIPKIAIMRKYIKHGKNVQVAGSKTIYGVKVFRGFCGCCLALAWQQQNMASMQNYDNEKIPLFGVV